MSKNSAKMDLPKVLSMVLGLFASARWQLSVIGGRAFRVTAAFCSSNRCWIYLLDHFGSTLGLELFFRLFGYALSGSDYSVCRVLSPLISDALLGSICMVGYTIVLCIGINFLEFTTIRTANLLPALLIPVIFELIKPLLTVIAAGFSAF